MATQKKLMKRSSTKKGEKENPYSERGVEKFSALLAEIEEKKRKIYSKFSPEEVSLIRFVHASDNKLKPVVIRANTNKLSSKQIHKEEEEKKPLEDAGGRQKEEKQKMIEVSGCDEDERKKKKKGLSMEVEIEENENNQAGMIDFRVSFMVILGLLLLIAVVGRYLKNYYLLKLQATVCPRIQTQ